MPVQVYHRLTTLVTITIFPNWEKRQKVLLLSICASQLDCTKEEQVLEVTSV